MSTTIAAMVKAVLDVPATKYGVAQSIRKTVYSTGFRLYLSVSRSRRSHFAQEMGALLKRFLTFTNGAYCLY
jgi:hypothetical protein